MRVLIADDNAIVRIGLRQVLQRMDEVSEIAEAENGLVAVEQAEQFEPDVVLLDVRMPVMGGLEALPRLVERAAVIMLTNDSDQATIAQAMAGGARGYLVHGALDQQQIRAALATCRAGGMVLGPEAASALTAPRPPATSQPEQHPYRQLLTAREAEVLEAAALGQSNAEIADQQFLSPRTVKNYLNSAYVKLGVHSRAEAVIAWREAVAP